MFPRMKSVPFGSLYCMQKGLIIQHTKMTLENSIFCKDSHGADIRVKAGQDDTPVACIFQDVFQNNVHVFIPLHVVGQISLQLSALQKETRVLISDEAARRCLIDKVVIVS